MTRIDSVRAATGTTKDSVRHAAEVVAPYAGTAKDSRRALRARGAYARWLPRSAGRAQPGPHASTTPTCSPGSSTPVARCRPEVDAAATRAAARTRKAARQAAEYAAPRRRERRGRGPCRGRAGARGGRRPRRRRARRAARPGVGQGDREAGRRSTTGGPSAAGSPSASPSLGLLAGGAIAAWKWWDKQANPDWLVEPPAATEVGDRGRLSVGRRQPGRLARPRGPGQAGRRRGR